MTSQNMTAHRAPAPGFLAKRQHSENDNGTGRPGKARSSRPRLPRGGKMLFQTEKAECVRTLARMAGRQRDDDFLKSHEYSCFANIFIGLQQYSYEKKNILRPSCHRFRQTGAGSAGARRSQAARAAGKTWGLAAQAFCASMARNHASCSRVR